VVRDPFHRDNTGEVGIVFIFFDHLSFFQNCFAVGFEKIEIEIIILLLLIVVFKEIAGFFELVLVGFFIQLDSSLEHILIV
jgi:hypothetical protein